MNGPYDIVATFKGGPNDGNRIELHGGPSAIVHAGKGGRYELDVSMWREKRVVVYNWRTPEDRPA